MSDTFTVDYHPEKGVEASMYDYDGDPQFEVRGVLRITPKGSSYGGIHIHRLTAMEMHALALQIAKAAQQLAARNERRQAKDSPQDVPFPVTDLQEALKETPE